MNQELPQANKDLLIQLVEMKMPFGKYKDVVLYQLPISYLEWFQRKGFPKGKLGTLLQTLYEIKLNGLEYLLKPLISNRF
ncbi:MAG: DUF3820 family protein [Chitinophagaceae bacterium]|jgi:uncharacterized protein